MMNAIPTGLRVLLIAGDLNTAQRIEQVLQREAPHCAIQRATDEPSFQYALDAFAPDLIVSDHAIEQFDTLRALRASQAGRSTAPFIVVAPTYEDSLVEYLRAGAAEFVLTSNLARLGPAITAALALREPLRKLTERQRQVLQLLAEGHSTREIARRLRLSVKTIETHRADLMKRLRMRDLASLVRYAIRVGLVALGQ